ncbi:hypothetical protein [Pseudomonas amygdali]|uniref:hypothetical protein n=1 Tax=Pseudomonas amygdali TaxID=47877 RepID=UPI0011C3660E|nr:hypothetical protein [Pseudomonas amygdali]
MTTTNPVTNEATKRNTAVNPTYTAILALGFKIEIRSQNSGKSRAYLTDGKGGRITENGTPIFVDFYDNKGQSVNPVVSREGSHLDSALKKILEKANSIDWLVEKPSKSKKPKLKM